MILTRIYQIILEISGIFYSNKNFSVIITIAIIIIIFLFIYLFQDILLFISRVIDIFQPQFFVNLNLNLSACLRLNRRRPLPFGPVFQNNVVMQGRITEPS